MAAVAPPSVPTSSLDTPLVAQAPTTAPAEYRFTCQCCGVAFATADEQRLHYKTDLHRYNMKRRIANLPPVTAEVFNAKVLERRVENVASAQPQRLSKSRDYESEGVPIPSHLSSKKHKAKQLQRALRLSKQTPSASHTPDVDTAIPDADAAASSSSVPANEKTEEELIAERLAAAPRLSSLDCLFSPHRSATVEENLSYMQRAHSFFVPDAEYCVDLPGLLQYLADKISVGYTCIACGRAFHSLEAVRKHMRDKAHCRVAYDSEAERLEVSDFYDFSATWEGVRTKKTKGKGKKAEKMAVDGEEGAEDEEWEDDDAVVSGEEDEVVYLSRSDDNESDADSDLSDADALAYGDTPFELVLPSGRRLTHRAMAHYSKQRPLPASLTAKAERRTIADRLAQSNGALVLARNGGFEVMKARNAGEAKWAAKQHREFRDIQRREQFKTKVAFIHNSQKHFRDPLLQ